MHSRDLCMKLECDNFFITMLLTTDTDKYTQIFHSVFCLTNSTCCTAIASRRRSQSNYATEFLFHSDTLCMDAFSEMYKAV